MTEAPERALTQDEQIDALGRYSFGWADTDVAGASAQRGLSEAAELIHPHAAPDGGDADVPTTILVDRRGIVRWIYRSPSVIAWLSPDELLRAIDQNLR